MVIYHGSIRKKSPQTNRRLRRNCFITPPLLPPGYLMYIWRRLVISSLKLTWHLKMDGWKMTFLLGRPTSCWFQPIWKNMSKIGWSPQVGVKINNHCNHHLAYFQGGTVSFKEGIPHLPTHQSRFSTKKNTCPMSISLTISCAVRGESGISRIHCVTCPMVTHHRK